MNKIEKLENKLHIPANFRAKTFLSVTASFHKICMHGENTKLVSAGQNLLKYDLMQNKASSVRRVMAKVP